MSVAISDLNKAKAGILLRKLFLNRTVVVRIWRVNANSHARISRKWSPKDTVWARQLFWTLSRKQ